jgi:hypothetical protein
MITSLAFWEIYIAIDNHLARTLLLLLLLLAHAFQPLALGKPSYISTSGSVLGVNSEWGINLGIINN